MRHPTKGVIVGGTVRGKGCRKLNKRHFDTERRKIRKELE